jgi:aminoglycoside phosphotransferase
MTSTTQDTLAIRVGRVVAEEHQRALERCEREPQANLSKATKRESDMRAWGMTYGVAFGLLLADDPDGDFDTIAEDALDGARAAFARWASINRRQACSPAIDEMLEAYRRLDIECVRALEGTEHGREFKDKMQGLIETIGMPEREMVE